MSAVINKPRAKAKPKAPERTAQAATAELITALKRGVDRVGMAYDNAEPGEPVGVLLEHVIEILAEAIRPIWNEPLTKADTDAAYSAMFVPLAALKGVIALSKDTVIEHVLIEAHAVLDAAQTSIDSCAGLSSLLPDGAVREETDFLRGRDIAIKMIDEGSALFGERDCYRRHREPGTAQDNFVNGYLSDIIEEPALRAGFTAVLSQVVGSGEGFDGKYFDGLTLAETQAGQLGADGTMQVADEQPAPMSVTATKAEETAAWDDDEMHEVNAMISEAIAVMRSRSQEANTDLLYGAIYAAQHAQSVLALGLDNRDARDCEDASAPIGVVCAVLDAVFLDVDDIALHGAWRLLDLAHSRLDAAVSKAAA